MKSAERANDPDAASALKEAMSQISERCWCAGWMADLEFSLWSMLEGAPRDFGMDEVSVEELDQLRRLAERAGGWWVFSDEDGEDEVFVSTAEWRAVFGRRRG